MGKAMDILRLFVQRSAGKFAEPNIVHVVFASNINVVTGQFATKSNDTEL